MFRAISRTARWLSARLAGRRFGKVVIPYVGPGLLAASVLGLGRAIGEAIAVTQVIGVTTHGLSPNFFNTGDTLASRIAGQFQGAASNLQIASLFYLALILLVLSLIFNLVALVIIRRVRGSANERRAGIGRPRRRASGATTGGLAVVGVVNMLMVGVCSFAALLAVAMLALIVFTVVIHGFKAISLDFFTQPTPQLAIGQSQGAGVANAIVGSLIIVAIATAIAFPWVFSWRIFTSEFASNRISQFVRLMLDVLNGVPSVVIGIFIFGLLVVGHGQAAWIAGVALAIIEVPLIARSTQEVLGLVPVPCETLAPLSAHASGRP